MAYINQRLIERRKEAMDALDFVEDIDERYEFRRSSWSDALRVMEPSEAQRIRRMIYAKDDDAVLSPVFLALGRGARKELLACLGLWLQCYAAGKKEG